MKAVLEEGAIPRKLVRRFPSYHEIPDYRERREAAVTLHLEGWSDNSIARYLKMDRSTAAPRSPVPPKAVQQALFRYAETL